MSEGAPTTILAPMRYATLVVNRLRANEPFRPGAGPNGGDFFLPWRQLRERFAAEGVELNTRDVNAGREVEFELHLNAQRSVSHPFSYSYLYEDPIVRPINGNIVELARYRKIFTSNEDLIDGEHVLSLDYPNDLTLRDVPRFKERDLFCVLIASNKARTVSCKASPRSRGSNSSHAAASSPSGSARSDSRAPIVIVASPISATCLRTPSANVDGSMPGSTSKIKRSTAPMT